MLVVAFHYVLVNAASRHDAIHRIVVNETIFYISTPVLIVFGLNYYFGCVAMLWTLCYKNLRAYRRNELMMARAIANERQVILQNGIYLYT